MEVACMFSAQYQFLATLFCFLSFYSILLECSACYCDMWFKLVQFSRFYIRGTASRSLLLILHIKGHVHIYSGTAIYVLAFQMEQHVPLREPDLFVSFYAATSPHCRCVPVIRATVPHRAI